MNRKLLIGPLVGMLLHCGGAGPAATGTDAQSPPPPSPPSGPDSSDAPEAGAFGDDGGADGGAAVDPDAGDAVATDAQADACTPGVDEPDDHGIDANCDGADGIVGTDVYVDPGAGQDTNDGTPSTPLRTLLAALTLATSRGGRVLVAAGEIDGDSLSVAGTWSAFGGYASTFLGTPSRALTVLKSSSSGLLMDQATTARLVHFTVTGGTPTDPKQPSAHALRSRVGKLSLDDVDIESADAAPGVDGASGAAGQAAGSTCSGAPLPLFARGASSGQFSPDGTTPPGNLSTPSASPQASAGAVGTDGADATADLRIAGDLVAGDVGTAGKADGSPGFGGAGGGEGGLSTQWGYLYIDNGSGGAGGCPGGGGAPGQTGGTSVAVLVLAGQLEVTRSKIGAGLGAAGGDGGSGGPGGSGGLGTAPAGGIPSGAIPPTCPTPSTDKMGLKCAAYGGQGGNGGTGGRGGGGAGGWSVGVLLAVGASATTDTTTTIAVARPGPGGLGNGGAHGPSGQAHSTFTLTQ